VVAEEQATYLGAKKANDMAPRSCVISVHALESPSGDGINAAHRRRARAHAREAARAAAGGVNGQSDVMVVGLPYICPYNVNSIMNPILVHCLGLGYLFNLYRNKPVVRPAA